MKQKQTKKIYNKNVFKNLRENNQIKNWLFGKNSRIYIFCFYHSCDRM